MFEVELTVIKKYTLKLPAPASWMAREKVFRMYKRGELDKATAAVEVLITDNWKGHIDEWGRVDVWILPRTGLPREPR